MDEKLICKLHLMVEQEGRSFVRCLAAAERAVEDGRFNIAKVMRAAAQTARVRALNLQRLLDAQLPPVTTVEMEQTRQHDQHEALRAILAIAQQDNNEQVISSLQQIYEAAPPLLDILDRSVESLRDHRDIMETDVAQMLWGCHDCGYIAEIEQPDTCPNCGALGAEFEWFGPFYAVTNERLGRRREEEIIAIVQKGSQSLEDLFSDVSDEILRHRPTPTEWCMKEVAGHMLDVTELFIERVDFVLASDSPQPLPRPVPPWKILEGKGYPNIDGHEILRLFREASERALNRISTLNKEDWVKKTLGQGKPMNVLDLGTWLANHNIAHLKQVEALREQFS